MNYPVWDVPFGAGLLIAIVSITHVFVSHFAVGGGLFLVLTERKAYRENDTALLNWLKIHTKFFVLLTVVFGAISGVGIWFTIALIHPSATSTLIHSYVWGWAIEWVFFFLEITAALLYLYGWNKLDRRTHLWLGWVYFINAFLSMVIINGIITFMLTSGKWVENHKFWVGFFNPTYFPSLFSRFAFSLALAGIYALVTASLQKNAELKGKIVKWSARWIVPAFIVLPFFVYWYVNNITPQVWASAKGLMPTATRYAHLIVIFSVATFVLSLLTLIKPRKMHFVFSLVVLVAAFTTMWAFEFIRESIRKPYIIANYMYGNSLYKTPMNGDGGFNLEQINQNGVLKTAKWVQHREITAQNQIAAGREIFRVQCQSCHTVDAYRGVKKYLQQRNWDASTIALMLGSLDAMHNGVMPPFAGTELEKSALAAYLATIHPATKSPEVTMSGKMMFQNNCAMCHRADPSDAVFSGLKEMDQETIVAMLEDLPALNPRMPNLKLTENERAELAKWLHE
jgi:mono/diheme cytochrome c family protein